jgi:hypothetical protein
VATTSLPIMSALCSNSACFARRYFPAPIKLAH